MRDYTLLIFNAADEVVDTKTLRAANISGARHMAEHILMTRRNGAGYQIWRKGLRVFSTYPQQPNRIPPLALIALTGTSRRSSSR